MTDCEHDYDHPIRKSRAYYVCPKCGQDITMMLVFIARSKQKEQEYSKVKYKKVGKK